MATQGQLTERVASGVAWSIGEKIGSALLQAIVSIVVANRIMPMDMGIMAVLTVFTTLAQVVVDSGFSQTLIRKTNPTAGDFRAVFRFNILISILLYLLLTVAAPYVAEYYGWPLLGKVAPVLFLLLPLNAMCVIQNTIMVREFRFAQLSTINFASSTVSGLIAIVMALAGAGIWSLVGQRLAMMATKATLLWFKSEWRPRKCDETGSLRQMAPFSLRLMATDIITNLYNNIAQLFIGKIYTGPVLGCYNQAQKMKDMPVSAMVQSIQSVTYPALARIGDNTEKFSESYRRVMMITAFVMFPVMAGLIATAEDFYMLLLKEEWHAAIPYFRILCVGGLFYPLSIIAYNVLKVKSDGVVILRLEVAKRIIMTLILIITIPQSVTAVAWGMAIAMACEMVLNIVAAQRYTTLSMGRLIRAIAPIVALTIAMYLLVMWVGDYSSAWSCGARLAVKIATGVAVYVAGGYLFRMEAMKMATELAMRFLSRKRD